MKKGFTLIELLAVLVILAIIALIAVPIVQNMIHDSRKNATLRSAEFYIDAVDQAISIRQTDIKFDLENGTYIVNQNGNLCINDACSETLLVDVENTKPTSGSVDIEDNRVVSINNLYFPKYKYNVSTINGILVASKNLNTRAYKSGDVVYFDVENGKVCSETEYKKSLGEYETFTILSYEDSTKKMVTDYGNSASGYNGIDNKDTYQNSCLKFYVINSTDDRVTLILDHNTLDKVSWSDVANYKNGPITALEALKDDTSAWKGMLTPTSYTYKRSANSCYLNSDGDISVSQDCDAINYTIDYAGYNARLITIEEVVKIANISTELGKTEVVTLNQSSISTDELRTKIGWLYDRVLAVDEKYDLGIPNKPITNTGYTGGYWTATASSWFYDEGLSPDAISVRSALLKSNGIGDLEIGVRPVIELAKDKLK